LIAKSGKFVPIRFLQRNGELFPRQFTYYESGFDFYPNGTTMHWDSQGTATPIPPRDISEANNKIVEPLYKAWCL
jgi:hypothetical protein